MSERKKLWSGDVPETWKVAPLKHCIAFRSDSLSEGTNPDYWFRYVDIGSVTACSGVTGYAEMAFRDAPSRARKRVRRGDTIVSTVRTYLKAIARIEDDEDVIVSTGFAVLEPCEFDSLYLTFLICSDLVCEEIERRSWGIAYPAISETSMSSIIVPIPPLFEQQLIADHLRRACAKLDSACSVLERQLQTLDDYRKSLIQEAVTKGLNPTVDMKPSGLDWVGDMPIHWQLKKVKNISESRNGLDYVAEDVCGPDDAGATLVVRSSNLDGNGMMFDDCVYLNKRIPSALRLQKDDIVIVRTNGSRELVGKNALVPENGIGTIGAFMLLCRTPYPRYLHWVLNSQLFPRYLGTFETSTVNQITNGNLRNMVVPFCPDPQERDLICDYLDTKCATVDRLIAGKRKQLETLRAQRQSLIYEYVTGKRRVL